MKNRARFTMLVLALVLLAGPLSLPNANAYVLDLDPPELTLRIVRDDNISRSPDGEGEKSDMVFIPALSVERQAQVGEHTFTRTSLKLEGAIHERYRKLNRVTPVLGSGLRHHLGDGLADPVLRLDLALGYDFYDQDSRFGAFIEPRIEIRARIEDRVDIALHYAYDNRFASEKKVFDVEGHSIGVTADLEFTEDAFFVLGYEYRRGDVVVHTRNPTEPPEAYFQPPVRGERLPLYTFKERYTAVHLSDADTHTVTIGLRYYWNLYTELHAGFTYEEIRKDSVDYPSNQFFLAVKHSL